MQKYATSVVTQISAQRRSPDRVNLYVDGQFLCGVALEVVVAEKILSGVVLSDAAREQLVAADARWRAKQAALSLLAVRARAKGELEQRLRLRSFDDAAISYAMDEVTRIGLIDDNAFAELWIRDRLRLRPRGANALVAELVRKRVAPDIALAAVRRVLQEEDVDEFALCRDTAERWMAVRLSSRPEEAVRTQRRLQGYLLRRGYPHAAVRDAVRRVMKGSAVG